MRLTVFSRAAVGLATVLVGTLVAVSTGSAAQAADPVRKLYNTKHAQCIWPHQAQPGTYVRMDNCADGGDVNTWRERPRSDPRTDRNLRQFQNIQYGHCIDSGGGSHNSLVLFKECNNGEHQMWELHSSGGYLVLKSWGAYVYGGQHLCLAATNDRFRPARLKTCDATLPHQRWLFLIPE